MKTVGVLALQGAIREHRAALDDLDIRSFEVRRAEHLEAIDGLILPGGESTTMSRLLDLAELFEPIQKRIDDGIPVLGTCAGMILLSQRIEDGRSDQRSFGAIDIDVSRNAYGAQSASFEAEIDVSALGVEPFPAVFIRAPKVLRTGKNVEVLARYDDQPALLRQGSVVVSSFHPELSSDRRVHRLFIEGV